MRHELKGKKGRRMVILRLVLNASPEKQRELKQALSYMISDIRQENLCSQANMHVDIEDENRILVLSLWESRESLDNYLRSEKFSALLGTRILLCSPLLAFIDTVAMREGLEAIMAIRSESKISRRVTATGNNSSSGQAESTWSLKDEPAD